MDIRTQFITPALDRKIPLHPFPSPNELWTRYRAAKGYTDAQQALVTQDYFSVCTLSRNRLLRRGQDNC